VDSKPKKKKEMDHNPNKKKSPNRVYPHICAISHVRRHVVRPSGLTHFEDSTPHLQLSRKTRTGVAITTSAGDIWMLGEIKLEISRFTVRNHFRLNRFEKNSASSSMGKPY